MLEKILRELTPKMAQVIERLEDDLKSIRTGRASGSLVEDILVPYYGTDTPLKQVASISTPDAGLIVIQPWDKGILGDIEKAIRAANLGLNPINDGQSLRLAMPPLTAERRQEFVKLAHQKAEAARIGLRTLRKESWEQIQEAERKGDLTEDDRYQGEDRLNKMIDDNNQKVEDVLAHKEKEITTL